MQPHHKNSSEQNSQNYTIFTKQDKDLKNFSNEPIKVLGKFARTVTYNDWTCEEACLTVVEDKIMLIIGRDLFNSLGWALVQQQAKWGKWVNVLTTLIILHIKLKTQSHRNLHI